MKTNGRFRKRGFASQLGLPGWRLKAAWGMTACTQSLSVLSSLLAFIFKWEQNICTSMYKHVQVQIRLWLLGPNNKLVDCTRPNPSKSNKPGKQHHQYQKALKAEATNGKAEALWQNQRKNIAFLLQTSPCIVFTTGLIGCCSQVAVRIRHIGHDIIELFQNIAHPATSACAREHSESACLFS